MHGSEDEGDEEEPPFMPSRRGREDKPHHDAMAIADARQERGGGGHDEDGNGDWDSDSDAGGMDAFSSMERRTEALIQAELDKAEESLYAEAEEPEPAASSPVAPQPTDTTTTTTADDAEAQFWATYRAQQDEAARKAKEKEANFAREWSAAFVHLRVQGRAIPRPPTKEEEEEEDGMVQSPALQNRGAPPRPPKKEGEGWAWFPSSTDSSSSGASRGYFSGSLEHVEVKGQVSTLWHYEIGTETEEEEIFAR